MFKLLRQLWKAGSQDDEEFESKAEAATKICPIMTTGETHFMVIPSAELIELPPVLCSTDGCRAWQERNIAGKTYGRCLRMALPDLERKRPG